MIMPKYGPVPFHSEENMNAWVAMQNGVVPNNCPAHYTMKTRLRQRNDAFLCHSENVQFLD